MVQINLPKNSEVKKGIYYKDKTGSKNIRKVNVYRWDPSSGKKSQNRLIRGRYGQLSFKSFRHFKQN